MDHDVLVKVIRMQATAQQQERVNAWLAESSRNRNEFEDLRLLLEPVGSLPSLSGMSRLIQSIHQRQEMSARSRRLAAALILFIAIIGGIAAYASRPPQPLTVRDASLTEVCAMLYKQYDISIEVSSGLQQSRWSGSFWQPAAEEVVPLLARSIDAVYTRSGDTYTLSPP